MILLRTEKKGWLSGVSLSSIMGETYGVHAKYVAWDEISDDGVVALVCYKNKRGNWEVMDHVYEMVNMAEPIFRSRPSWL